MSIYTVYPDTPVVLAKDASKIVVELYRGSDTENIEGVSWWTTNAEIAEMYAEEKPNGRVFKRIVELPVTQGHLVSPNRFITGGRSVIDGTFFLHGLTQEEEASYLYGITSSCVIRYEEMPLENLQHFNISIHHTILNGLTIQPNGGKQ